MALTQAGMVAVGTAPADAEAMDKAGDDVAPAAPDTVPADTPHEPGSAPQVPPAALKALLPTGAGAAQQPSTRPSLRDAVHRALAAWDDAVGERAGLPHAIAALRPILVKPAPAARTSGPRKPREGTKQRKRLFEARLPSRPVNVLGRSGAAGIRTTLWIALTTTRRVSVIAGLRF
ncbi:hypothetical protein [Paracraurococcus lichenis]|uniref:Uncharacterized protein n=1 Tax=Paracraurococcus lichenis TaxID=3064888 RepID=A0ABT9ECJ8_9PROT|nr:hypothetical protein [Paracraurococcus sp. LOR1-02]MDO9713932.1 hypothetical protein [Paracraurococcus sp. LOR1-02]